MSFAQFSQSQIPLLKWLRSSEVRDASARGPPSGDAATMWHATPMLAALSDRERGPRVAARHPGFEQVELTLSARIRMVGCRKSSRIGDSDAATIDRPKQTSKHPPAPPPPRQAP